MKSMTIEQAEKLITPGGKWVMLDIRSQEEFLRSSYPEALSIPQRDLTGERAIWSCAIRETTAGTLSACFRTMALMRQTWMAAGELIFV